MIRVLYGLAFGAGIPLAGLALLLSSTVLVAFGPPVFDGWVGKGVTVLFMLAAFLGVMFSQFRYERGLVFVGAWLPLGVGLFLLHGAFHDSVLLGRGELTTCTIVDVARHQRSTDNGIEIWYENDLTCDRPEVTAMRTGRSVGEVGDPVTVLFDPAGRLNPRPADAIGNPRTRAMYGAIALGVGIVIRLIGERDVESRRDLSWRAVTGRRKERRRIRQLARAHGNPEARVNWLLPYYTGEPYLAREPRYAYLTEWRQDPDSSWLVRPVLAERYRVTLPAAPPAVEQQARALSDVYLIATRTWRVANVIGGDTVRVAADAADLRRWNAAAEAYLNEVAEVNRILWDYWLDRGQRLGVSRGRAALLRDWQYQVRYRLETLVRAADAYRPVFDEITAAAETTRLAEEDLIARHRRLQKWASRRLWYLQSTPDGGLLIVRSDVSGESAPDGARSLPQVYEDATRQQRKRLIPVDWDEASLLACDAELAEISAAHPPVGATSSGRPMTRPSPATFASWFKQEYGIRHDRISDRKRLARRRQERDQLRSSQSRGQPARPSFAGGSWPTDMSHIDDHGGGDHSGGDYSGGDYGGSGYSGGGDYGGGGYSGGFSVGGSY